MGEFLYKFGLGGYEDGLISAVGGGGEGAKGRTRTRGSWTSVTVSYVNSMGGVGESSFYIHGILNARVVLFVVFCVGLLGVLRDVLRVSAPGVL